MTELQKQARKRNFRRYRLSGLVANLHGLVSAVGVYPETKAQIQELATTIRAAIDAEWVRESKQ